MREKASNIARYLPSAPEGWTVSEKDKEYGRKNLYEYIDGGAELYLSYDFQKVVNRIYTAQGQPDILLDLFDMGSSQNAFGVFSHAREVVDTTFGQGSQYTAGLLMFWKNRFFVSILASPETDGSKEAVFKLAGLIDDAIREEGSLPEILTLLPKEGLAEESIRYFRHYIWVNFYYYIADENILHINDKTDAVLAKYGEGHDRALLLLVQYPSSETARSAQDYFIDAYLPELSGRYAVQIEDGTWTACRLEKSLLIVVFNASRESDALDLIERTTRLKTG
ncbi:MAG: DUF6599 family protein [bacterium]